MCFSHPQNLLAGWAGPTVAAGYAKIWDDFAAAWRARKGDDGSQGPRPSLVQWVARQTEDLPEGMRSFARAAQLRRLEIDGGSVMEWDELPEFVKTALEASTYDKMLFDSRLPEETPEIKMEFQKGDAVTIKEGPFENYEGTVDEVMPEKGLVRVLVTIFGRQAPVELEYWQISRGDE